MKIVRYTILALVAITIHKHARSESPDQQISNNLIQKFKPFEVSLFDRQAVSKDYHEYNERSDLYGFGIYNSSTKTATIDFNQVLEQNQAVTPAWVLNPKYIQIGTMPTENYIPSNQRLAGGRSKTTRLYGILNEPADNQENDESLFEINFYVIIQNSRYADKILGRYYPETKQASIVFTDVVATREYKEPSNPSYIHLGICYIKDATIPGLTRDFHLFGIPEIPQPEQPKTEKTSTNTVKAQDLKRDINAKTATKDKQKYVAVIEYNPLNNSIPSITNPSMSYIAEINNPEGFGPNLQLWGIPVTGKKIPVKNNDKKTIGYYWQEPNIIQLLNGETFVEIMKKASGNYMQHTFHGIGPVWTWYQTPEYDNALAQKYNMSAYQPHFNQLVDQNGIGTIRHDRQTYVLFGVLLSPRTMQSAIVTTRSVTAPALSDQVTRQLQAAAHENEAMKITPVVNRSTLAAGFAYNIARRL